MVKQRAAEGAAVVYTTHYLPELTELGATIAVAKRGRVIARGSAEELLGGLPGEVVVGFADGGRAGSHHRSHRPRCSTCCTRTPGRAVERWKCATPTSTTSTAPWRAKMSTESLRRVGLLVRFNMLLRLRDPGQLISYIVLPMVLMVVFKPLYVRALAVGTLRGGGRAAGDVLGVLRGHRRQLDPGRARVAHLGPAADQQGVGAECCSAS